MGHNSKDIKLDTEYYDEEMNPELRFNEFKKIVFALTIDDSARQKVELESERAEKTELQKKVDEIDEMKRQQADENARRDQALEYLMKKEQEREQKSNVLD